MTKLLRVGIVLPAHQRVAVVDYLHRQPLLPTWRLSLVLIDPNSDVDRLIHVMVVTTAYRHRASPQLARHRTPAVIIATNQGGTDISSTIGMPGVRAIVVAEDPPETLALGIAAAATHGVWVPEPIWQQLERPPVAPEFLGATASLTPAERETLGLLAQGLTNTAIARARHVQLSTVKYHIGNIRLKTGAVSRSQLVLLARHSQIRGESKSPPG